MQCTKVTASRGQLLDPTAGQWASIAGESLKLDATPLANQPSEYIKASRDEKQIGKVRSLEVKTVHNGSDVFFRLSWEDATKDVEINDSTTFLDACGILIPLKGGDPPIDEMGSKDYPVNAWFWRGDYEDGTARNTFAKGLGTTEFSKDFPIQAKAVWAQNGWSVVFARPLAVPELKEEAVQMAAGSKVKIGFSVWEGSNGERGGVKSFSKEWLELTVEA
jgi:DMSO reductase family type II enzyme heme b subunit